MTQTITIPRAEYDRLCAAADELSDLQAHDRAQAALAAGEEELIPAAHANRLIAGENRVTVAEIETGRKQGSIATLRALADALGVGLDDLA